MHEALNLLAALPQAGGYVGAIKLAVLFLAAIPWLWGASWVDKDAKTVHLPQMAWALGVVGAGVVGLLAWLLLPVYLVGLGVYLVLTGAVGAVYVMQRNGRVVPEARVLTPEHISALFQGKHKSSVAVQTRIKVHDNAGQPVPPPDEDSSADEKAVYNLTQELLYDMIWRRVSEAAIATIAQPFRYMIDGVVVNRDNFEPTQTATLIDYLKGIAGMDVADKRRPQKGKIVVDLAGSPMDITLSCDGSTGGQRMRFRIVQESVRTRLGELGMADDVLQHVQQINLHNKGLTIVACQPGNGLTSTLYALLRDNDAYIKQLVTVEDNIEVDLENVTQNAYKGPGDMARTLANAMRRDPDVIMVDRCPTPDGAKLILDGAAEKRVILGMHARDTFNALARWVKMAGSAPLAVKSLDAVLCQVLLRKLCPACREAYRPNAEMLHKANLPAGTEKFYRPPTQPLTDAKGNPVTCATCQGSGYLGRTAAFELLEVDDKLRKVIAGGPSLTEIKGAARKNKMLYLQEQALGLVLQGITSVQEVIRVTREEQPQGQAETKQG
jgi:general secretion pathway protein E